MRTDCLACGRACAMIERTYRPWDGPETHWYEWECRCGVQGRRSVETIDPGEIL